MTSNLTLPIVEERQRSGPRIIALSRSAIHAYVLCVGENDFISKLAYKDEERLITVNNISIAKRILKEQLHNGGKPAYIICNLNDCTQLGDFTRHIRASKELSDIPVFVYLDTLTAESKQELRRTPGIDQVITADTTKEQFAEKLDAAQTIRRLAKDVSSQERRAVNAGAKINYCLKRMLDITVAGTGLIVLSPLLLVIAALIKLESKGPVFYISHRAGQRYRIFKFYKFRTMVADADKKVSQMSHLNQYDTNSTGPVFFKVSNDPRVTKLGGFLRNTSLDEIPQLLNVLLGHMSLVGNRPLPLYEAASLTTDHYAGRFMAPAGLTGLWQIKKRGNKEMSVDERIRLDIEYAEKHSVLYDMWILASTPNALIQKDNV
jgi:lipopolysaccharide/colanic/teichoic acid biosynthesis glycosyltransferase